MAINDYQTALVTGASSGIGSAVVRALRERDVTVYALARRRERLEQLAAETGCIARAVDLRDHDALYAGLRGLKCDILVNNAGLGRGMSGLFDCSPEDVNATIGTNVTALYHLLKATVPGMQQRGRGHVVNIGSVAGLYPINSAVYGGSKGAVHLLSQNLRLELRGSGVRVTEICPGRVDTEFFDVAIDDLQARDKAKNPGIDNLAADDIADAVLYALTAPRRVNVSTVELTPTEQSFGGTTLTPLKS